MKDYKVIPPKQKYLTIAQMFDTFGSRGLVAYSCKIVDSVLEGGVVVAVQNEVGGDTKGIKEYQLNLRRKYPDKDPIYYLRLEPGKGHQKISLTYDNGGGEKTIRPKLEVKKSEAEEAISQIPDDVLAQALAARFREDD